MQKCHLQISIKQSKRMADEWLMNGWETDVPAVQNTFEYCSNEYYYIQTALDDASRSNH